MIKVLITDDHPVVRKGIRLILEDEPGIELVHEASDGKEMLKMAGKCQYDVVLLDISLPGRSGLDLLPQLKSISPTTAVLILSIHSEKVYAINALKAGASGYLNKTSAPGELVKAVMKVARGGRYLPESIAGLLADAVLTNNSRPLHDKLSQREREVLLMIAEGKPVKSIAEELSLSPKTISTYRERILAKLKISTNAELIKYVLAENLIK